MYIFDVKCFTSSLFLICKICVRDAHTGPSRQVSLNRSRSPIFLFLPWRRPVAPAPGRTRDSPMTQTDWSTTTHRCIRAADSILPRVASPSLLVVVVGRRQRSSGGPAEASNRITSTAFHAAVSFRVFDFQSSARQIGSMF
jgi:hypothetical protein